MVIHGCPHCAYTTSIKTNLKSHLRTHTGEKPYACNECDKCFSQQSHLSAHVRTHSDDKEFACDQCSYRTSRKDHLKLHIRRNGIHSVYKFAASPPPCAHCAVPVEITSPIKEVKVCSDAIHPAGVCTFHSFVPSSPASLPFHGCVTPSPCLNASLPRCAHALHPGGVARRCHCVIRPRLPLLSFSRSH
jgi:hypothetical protein